MKFSYNWLSELIDGLEVTPEELNRLITMKTAECEGIEAYGQALSSVVAARVRSAEKVEGTHLSKAVIDAGPAGIRHLVCGAPNCREGLLTAWWPLGKKTVRGIESDGMLASAAELGINRDHEGILELEGLAPGDPLPGLRPDTIIEIDNKSLTHRPDLWGHHGMAREVAAIAKRPLLDPVDLSLLPSGPAPIQIDIRDYTLCPRYSALVFENVTVQPSPLWLQYRLAAIGLNPINNIVDVTNWVMSELAQPMHAFDRDKINGDTIVVRRAGEGESCHSLLGTTYRLNPSNLVIADRSGNLAIAGVVGGGPSAITAGTTRILLESANFQAASVRKTSSDIKLRTDASMRFEKSQDPVNTVRALARAIALLEIVSPGIRLVGGLADSWRPAPSPLPIEFTHDWMQRKLGREIAVEEVTGILKSLSFGVEADAGRYTVTVPSWRATKDISMKADMVEEIGRMIGYGSIPPQAPLVPSQAPLIDPARPFYRSVRQVLAAQGFTEVYNYSFVSEAQVRQFDLPLDDHIRVINPIAAGQELLRASLLPNILKNIEDNCRLTDNFRLFEIGREIHKRTGSLPDEVPHLAVVLYAREGDGLTGMLELKRIVNLLVPGIEAVPAEAKPYEHPHRVAELYFAQERGGRIFEFHPGVVEVGRAQVAYLNLERLQALQPALKKYTPLRRFPTSSFDITVPAGLRTTAAEILSKARAVEVENLVSAEYLYEYLDTVRGVKSLTLRFTLGATDRTLTSDEIHAAQSRLRTALA